jgi:aerobic-type carbon monoxide dehydrogenase small subunit (CoxS/CutS family)
LDPRELYFVGATVAIRGACRNEAFRPTIFAVGVGERAVTTIEGLAAGEVLHPVEEAFVEHVATQRGFGSPGRRLAPAR